MIFPQGILADLKALWGIHESWLFSKTGACGLGFRQRRVNPDEFNVLIIIESYNVHFDQMAFSSTIPLVTATTTRLGDYCATGTSTARLQQRCRCRSPANRTQTV